MIEFDESEYLESTVSDLTLSWVLFMFGGEVKDKLLYNREGLVRPDEKEHPTPCPD